MAGGVPGGREAPRGPEPAGSVSKAFNVLSELTAKALDFSAHKKKLTDTLFGGEVDASKRKYLAKIGKAVALAVPVAAAGVTFGPDAARWLMSDPGNDKRADKPGEAAKPPEPVKPPEVKPHNSAAQEALSKEPPKPEKPTEQDMQVLKEQLNEFLAPEIAAELYNYLQFSDRPDRLLTVLRSPTGETLPDGEYTLYGLVISEIGDDNEENRIPAFSLNMRKNAKGETVSMGINYYSASNGRPQFSRAHPNFSKDEMENILAQSFTEKPPINIGYSLGKHNPDYVRFQTDKEIGEGDMPAYRHTKYLLNSDGEVNVLVQYSNQPTPIEEEVIERKAEAKDIVTIGQTLKKYVRPDTDPKFWSFINHLGVKSVNGMGESAVSVYTRSSGVEYLILAGDVTQNRQTSLRMTLNNDGSERIEGRAYRNGDLGFRSGVVGRNEPQMDNETMKDVGGKIFIFPTGEPTDSRLWNNIQVEKNGGRPPATGVQTHTKLNGKDVTYQIDDWNTFEIKASPAR